MSTNSLPLLEAGKDVVARYSRGNNMLASAAIALRALKERVDAGEPDEDGKVWDWASYRHHHLEPHITPRWINQQLQLAPPGANEEQVAANARAHLDLVKTRMSEHRDRRRQEPSGNNVIPQYDVLPSTIEPPLLPDWSRHERVNLWIRSLYELPARQQVEALDILWRRE